MEIETVKIKYPSLGGYFSMSYCSLIGRHAEMESTRVLHLSDMGATVEFSVNPTTLMEQRHNVQIENKSHLFRQIVQPVHSIVSPQPTRKETKHNFRLQK